MAHRPEMKFLLLGMLVGFLIAGCSGDSSTSEGEGVDGLEGRAQSEQMEGSGAGIQPRDYNVPAAEAEVVNPIPADDASVARGEEIYQSVCADCHGEEGRGDGPLAVAFDPQPVDFQADFVRSLSDGELFYIITNGIEDTEMPDFGYFDEEDRWSLVNYLRTLQN